MVCLMRCRGRSLHLCLRIGLRRLSRLHRARRDTWCLCLGLRIGLLLLRDLGWMDRTCGLWLRPRLVGRRSGTRGL
jgi:hypothetical protein